MISVHRIAALRAKTSKQGSAWVELIFAARDESEIMNMTLFFETSNRDNYEEEKFAKALTEAINNLLPMAVYSEASDD